MTAGGRVRASTRPCVRRHERLVDVPALKCSPCSAVISDDFEHNLLYVRAFSPVVSPSLKNEFFPRFPPDQSIGATTHGSIIECFIEVALRVDVFRKNREVREMEHSSRQSATEPDHETIVFEDSGLRQIDIFEVAFVCGASDDGLVTIRKVNSASLARTRVPSENVALSFNANVKERPSCEIVHALASPATGFSCWSKYTVV